MQAMVGSVPILTEELEGEKGSIAHAEVLSVIRLDQLQFRLEYKELPCVYALSLKPFYLK